MDIRDVTTETVTVNGERFQRIYSGDRATRDFARIDGGYNATEEQLERYSFTILQP